MTTGRGRGTRAMQLLAVRLIERRSPDDAIVLGDAMNELGLNGLITGRSRPVVFRTIKDVDGALTSASFVQPGHEIIYNVPLFAADPTPERWAHIWTGWFTPPRGTYQALVRQGLLARSVPFHELEWRAVPTSRENILLAYRLFRSQVPKKRKRPVSTLLMEIVRRASDNPQTDEQHFGDTYQLPLL